MKKNHTKSTEYNEQKQIAKDQLIQRLQENYKSSKQPQDIIMKMLNEQDIENLEKMIKKLGIWPCRIDQQFIEDLLQQPDISFEIFVYMILISDGYFCPFSPITTSNLITNFHCGLLQHYFCCITPENYHFYFEIGLEKKSIIKKNEFLGFQTIHRIHFLAIRFDRRIENVLLRLFNYNQTEKLNSYRQNFGQLNFDSTTSIQRKQKYFCLEKPLFYWNEVEEWGECQFNFGLKDQQCMRWIPTGIQTKQLDEKQLKQYYYDQNLSQWVKNEDIEFLKKYKQNRDLSKQNKHILHQYADFESGALIIDIMQKLPDFKILITQQERKVIASKQNSLIIGRSGTGKTTCTVLRLFAIQTLFKIRQKLFNQENEKLLFNYQDIPNKVGLHCVFTTQNHVLIGEVRKYYRKLLQHIQDSIKRNQEKQQNQQQNIPLSLDQSFISQSFQICDEINESSISMILQEESFICTECEDDKEEMEEDDQLEDVDLLGSLEQMSDDKFPAFLSLKKLILLIDSSLKKPFFEQERFKKNGKRLQKAGWNTGKTIKITQKLKTNKNINVIDIDENAKFEEQEFKMLNQQEVKEKIDETKLLIQKQEEKAQQNQKQNQQESNIQVTEVDYEYFLKRFWPTIKKPNQKYGCDERSFPTLIWTQVYSYIKGSQFSYSYPMKYLPKAIYAELNPSNLSQDIINLIYDYFLEYEKWKLSCGIFDLMDLVNYIICELDKGDYKTVPIHYLFVDEVQDLPHAVITLFTRLIEQGYYFCGDTAQNIVKGVGFRFQDLKNMFKHVENPLLLELEQFQLTINFRSHNNILQLANSIVNLIELFFPKAIDRLNKEISDLKGPMPMLIQSNNIDDLFNFLTGDVNPNLDKQAVPIEFGCNQVVLVKDSDARDNIPSVLAHALILTIYESKGLEFEDVILFNFFTDNTILQSQWDLFNQLFIDEVEVDRDEYNYKLTRHEQQNSSIEDIQDNNASFSTQNEQGNILVKKLRLKPSIKSFDLNNYNALCNELKYLYVAATRAKNRLIIFDEQPDKRSKIQDLWQSLNLIQILDESYFQNAKEMNKIITQNTKEEWYATGMKMFANKYYDQAIKCFDMSGHQLLYTKSQAYAFAFKAEKQLLQSENFVELSEDTHLPQNLRRQYKDKYEKSKSEMFNNFNKAAEKFLECNMKKNAAACFFSAQQYEQSLIYYLQTKCWEEAAEVAFKLKYYHIAGILWLKTYKIDQSIEAFNQFQNNLITLHLLYEFKYELSDDNKNLWQILLPQVLQECWLQYFKSKDAVFIEKKNYSGKKLDFSILEKHTDFQYDFNSELIIIQASTQDVNTKEKMYQTLFNYLYNFLDEILIVLSKVFINYPIQVMKESMLKKSDEFKQNQIAFIQNVLEYFDIQDLQLFMLETTKSSDRDNYFISCLYYISPLYQPCFSLNFQFSNYQKFCKADFKKNENNHKSTLEKSEQKLSTFTFSSNKLLMSYSLCQLGLYETAIKSYQKHIAILQSTEELSLTSSKIKIYMQNMRSIFELFQQYQSLLQTYNIEQTMDFRFEKQKQDRKLIQVILGYYYSNNQDLYKLKSLKYDYLTTYIDKLEEVIIINKSFDRNCKYLFRNSNYQIHKTIILSIVAYQDEKIMQSLYDLNYLDFQLFLIELQKVVDLFKYNRNTVFYNETFKSICAIYQLSVATSQDFQFLGQSYIIVNKSSLIFETLANNYKQQQFQAFQFDIKGDFFLFSSYFVVKTIQRIYKEFLKTYVHRYCMKKTASNNNVPFLIQIYSFCAIKTLKKENKIMNKYLDQTLADWNLLNCLEYQLSDQIFNIWYQIPKIENPLNRQMYENLTNKSFAKVLTDQTKEELHIHLLTGIHALNIAYYYNVSLEFIQNLIKARKRLEYLNRIKHNEIADQNPFLTQNQLQGYQNYIEYLLRSQICMSMKNISQYIEYHTLLSSISFSEQIYRDLTFCTLIYIICKRSHYQYTNKLAELEKDAKEAKEFEDSLQLEQQIINEIIELKSFRDFKQQKMNLILPKKAITFLQTLSCQKVQIDEQFDDSQIQKFIQILIELFKTGDEQPLFLLAAIIINVETINIEIQMALEAELIQQISQKRRKMIENILEIADEEFERRHDLVLKMIDKGQSVFTKFTELEINYSNISMKTFNNFQEDALKDKLTTEYINENINYQLDNQERKKFKSLYVGMRFTTYQPLVKEDIFFNDSLLRIGGSSEIYDQVNILRSKLIEILYTKQLQKPVNFNSIREQLKRLSQLEGELDDEFVENSKQGGYGRIQKRQFEYELEEFDEQIETWIQENSQLSNKFQNIENQINKNVQKKTIAMCLIQKKSNQRW
ncbi:unnamed protein product [Paramecium primaurelia]|uniref:UvrD-like helicase ATP-binding domain-containing protein n=1 Tax=Paramecium primaurelia TaxID=5886 RepID=A0A8S1PD97_PARPR|nr:unnamed protein product [Paramecium primaurelia]